MPAPTTKKKDNLPENQLDSFIDRFTPEVAALARTCLAKMRARLPSATQLVYDNYNALAGFPDPHKLLKGSGSVVRHIVLESAADLDQPGVQRLMAAALKSAIQPH